MTTGNAIDPGLIEDALESAVSEAGMPDGLREAVTWSLLAPGKRLRPRLTIDTARMFGADQAEAIIPAVAIELIHTYSLIHDDLPAMDDDDTRRGRATSHVKFDEATAILAGDTLLSMAFGHLAAAGSLPEDHRRELIALIARAAGGSGMTGGQFLDLTLPDDATVGDVDVMHAMKTGALISASVTAGAIVAGASAADRTALARFGDQLGLLFQATDDLLDVTGDTAETGKPTGTDARNRRATRVTTHGIDAAHTFIEECEAVCHDALSAISVPGEPLAQYVALIARRSR